LRSIPVFVTVFFLILSVSSLLVQAQQAQYSIPIHPIKLGFTVGIVIPAEPAWAHQSVLDAMGIWNQAQEWFTQTYYPNGKTYHFIESEAGGVHVIFEYLNDQCGTTGSDVKLRLSNAKNETRSPLTVTICGLHEFGHLLGLEHTAVSKDLMNGQLLWIPSYPSTLDLYAVHVISAGVTSRRTVALPSGIPYMTVPEEALPEFPLSSELIVSVVLLLAFALVKRRRF
jgi:hypothetical protein